ncbi:MAG: hypothetical protein D6766_14700, partial [Verrucomicrobia bacterium]
MLSTKKGKEAWVEVELEAPPPGAPASQPPLGAPASQPAQGAPASLPAADAAKDGSAPGAPISQPTLGAPASQPAQGALASRPAQGALASQPAADAATDGSAPTVGQPSYVPASRETSRVVTNVSSPEPHRGWHSRGYLPHWDHPGMIQFVTFRLHDAVPQEMVAQWQAELGLTAIGKGPWDRAGKDACAPRAGKDAGAPTAGRDPSAARAGRDAGAPGAPISQPPRGAPASQPAAHAAKDGGAPKGRRGRAARNAGDDRLADRQIELRRRIEQYEDAGHGACWLRDPRIAGLVENALLHFDGQRYRLLAWCVMPNHVHVLIETRQGWPLADVVHSWKSFTASEANKLLGRSGPFWFREYHDRYIRNAEHYAQTVRYIEANPVKAGLVKLASEWPFGSARRKASL